MDDFFEIYNKNDKLRHIAEICSENVKPFIIDFDFEFDEEPDISKKEIKKIVDDIIKIFEEIFNEDEKYDCFVLQRKEAYEKNNT